MEAALRDRERPEITVVVPSHERTLRLRWLLNALEEQTLAHDRFEVVIVHDTAGEETARLLAEHPLRRAGILRDQRLAAGTGSAARQRNVGWRMARAPLVAFTDDDCRPAPSWLTELLRAAPGNENAIVQGATRPDPYETDLMAAAHYRTLHVDPPGPYGQTCNILYPRAVLERSGGFDERFPTPAGEDTDLLVRARPAADAYLGAPEAIVYHAVESFSLARMIRLSWKWRHLPLVLNRHPQLRELLVLRLFWRPSHLWLSIAVAGVLLSRRRRRRALVLAAPYLRLMLTRRGTHLTGRLRSAVELPGAAAIDLTEIVGLFSGSVRYRTPML